MGVNISHQPLKAILDREMAIAEAKEQIDKHSPYIEELVNYATHLFARCEKSLKGVDGSPSALIHLYFHVIQMADGIQVLCYNACFDAAIPELRSLWEASLSVHYMLDVDFADRSTAWLACSHLSSRDYWGRQQDATRCNTKNLDSNESDMYLGINDPAEKHQDSIANGIEMYEDILKKDKFDAVLKKLSKEARKNKKWYSINGGATNLRDLASRLKRSREYDILYPEHSSLSHAKDAGRTIALSEDTPVLSGIRRSNKAAEVYALTSFCLLDVTRKIAGKLRPNEHTREDLKEIILRHRPEAGTA